ncbi:MAG: hypothetical protein AMXMBFR78_04620 [Rubrivivax sp.]|jgi:prophage regulatory protein
MQIRFERLCEVTRGNATSRTTVYADIAKGLFPRPVKIGVRAVAWPAHETEAVRAARLRGASESELRELVARLHAQRAGAGA